MQPNLKKGGMESRNLGPVSGENVSELFCGLLLQVRKINKIIPEKNSGFSGYFGLCKRV